MQVDAGGCRGIQGGAGGLSVLTWTARVAALHPL